MINTVYLATETMSALIILILIYANNFEIKHRTKKRTLFNWMLILNEIVVVSDAVTFFPIPWQNFTLLFNILMVIVFTFPSLFKILFLSYLYEHISAKTPANILPFIFLRFYSLVESIIIFLLCVSGKMYHIEGGVYYTNSMGGSVYSILSLFSMIGFIFIISIYAKKLGAHDTIAVLPYSIIPLFSMLLLAITGLNLMVTILAFNMLIMYVTVQSENESYLYNRANIDELTGLYNRTAYEEEIENLKISTSDLLVYASIDLNGLKAANDSMGHVAGDELIQGAASCLRRAFAGSGKVYRTGGDEFVAIFYPDGNNFKIDTIKEALNIMTKRWKGKYSNSMALSVGYASKAEFPNEDITGLSKIADKRMYADKSNFYASKGVDRRGQNNAYKVLLKTLYTKILKINITNDSFTVIDMFSNEQTEDMGYSESIFSWFSGFAKTGLVHPDDVEKFLSKTNPDYMRKYFKDGNGLLAFSYRRKYDDEFRQTVMEIIPTTEYADDDQTLYLYVKSAKDLL